jgi:hypothetical protein
MTGFNSKISPRLTLTGNFGWVFGNSYQTNPNAQTDSAAALAVLAGGAFVPQVGAANGFVWDVGLSYRLFKTTSVSLNASEMVVPLFTGQLQKTQQIGLSLSHTINRVSSLGLSAGFTVTPATSGNTILGGQSTQSDFLSASVNYSYRLAREWRTNLSYSYLQRHDNTGTVSANIVHFTLSRDFTLLGRSTPINAAESERAKARTRPIGYVFPGLF